MELDPKNDLWDRAQYLGWQIRCRYMGDAPGTDVLDAVLGFLLHPYVITGRVKDATDPELWDIADRLYKEAYKLIDPILEAQEQHRVALL